MLRSRQVPACATTWRKGMPATSPQPPEQCPYCGSTAVIRIVYGLPSAALEEAARREELAIGGCLVPHPQKWACRECGTRWPLPEAALESGLVRSALALMYRAHGNAKRK